MDKAIVEASRVQIGHLDSKNFKSWKYRILVVIKAIPGALEIIEGRRCRPQQPPATADAAIQAKYDKDLQEFVNIDSVALVLITTNMTDEILNHVMRLTSSKEVWEELNRLFGETSEDKSYNLCLNFFSYKKDPEHTMATHISALKNIWHELNGQLESKLPDMLLICKILDTTDRIFCFQVKLVTHHPPYEYHQRTKHIRLRSFFVRECVERKILNVCKVPASVQLADMLTKPLYGPRIEELCKKSGLNKNGAGC